MKQKTKSEAYQFIQALNARVLDEDRRPLCRGFNDEDDECPSVFFGKEKHQIQSARYEGKKDTCYLHLAFETVCIKGFSKVLNENMMFPKARLWQKGKGHTELATGVQLVGMDWFFDEDAEIMDEVFWNEF